MKTRKFVWIMTLIAAVALPSAFAESRHPDETWRDRGRNGRAWQASDRVTMEGTIRSLRHERGLWLVQLDRGGHWFRVPERCVGHRAHELRVGAFVRFGGVFRGGGIWVDVVEWPDRGRYDDRYDGRYGDHGRYRDVLRGVVERVDYGREVIVVRSGGRYVTVDLDRVDRRRGVDADDLRRGDFVELAGRWRGGIFEADRVVSVRSGRW